MVSAFGSRPVSKHRRSAPPHCHPASRIVPDRPAPGSGRSPLVVVDASPSRPRPRPDVDLACRSRPCVPPDDARPFVASLFALSLLQPIAACCRVTLCRVAPSLSARSPLRRSPCRRFIARPTGASLGGRRSVSSSCRRPALPRPPSLRVFALLGFARGLSSHQSRLAARPTVPRLAVDSP